jgi:hypothetical protein
MIKDALGIDNVFQVRPNSLSYTQLPAVCVYFASENLEVSEGDRYIPDQYDRNLLLAVDIFAEQPNDPDSVVRVEDELDSIGRVIEQAFFDDYFFTKRLSTYTGGNADPGLLARTLLRSVTPYQTEGGSDRVISGQVQQWELAYIDDALVEKKAEFIKSYLMEIKRVGWDDQTVDSTLIAAEGDFE